MILLDSFAWVELFTGTEKGAEVRGWLRDENEVYTTVLNLYEVYYKFEETKGPKIRKEVVRFMERKARIVPITTELAKSAARLRLSDKLSAVDAFTLAAARQLGCRLLTGDKDFSKFKDVIML